MNLIEFSYLQIIKCDFVKVSIKVYRMQGTKIDDNFDTNDEDRTKHELDTTHRTTSRST